MTTMQQIRAFMASASNPVQLVLHYDEANHKLMKWPAWAEQKEDGVWCGLVKAPAGTVGPDEVAFFSRTGNEFYHELETLDLQDVVYNAGTGLYIAELVNPVLSLEELSGLVSTNRVKPWTGVEYEAMKHCRMRYHDYIPLDDLLQGHCTMWHRGRRAVLLDRIPVEHVIPGMLVHDEGQWKSFVDKHIALGHEGAVRKETEGDWVAGHKGYRVTKEVRGIDLDLRCIGVCLEGKGKRAGTLSKIYVSYKGKKVGCDLGKGWTDEKRAALLFEYRVDPSSVVGKVWHIHALQEGSKGSLRLPKAMSRRIDKTIADDEV